MQKFTTFGQLFCAIKEETIKDMTPAGYAFLMVLVDQYIKDDANRDNPQLPFTIGEHIAEEEYEQALTTVPIPDSLWKCLEFDVKHLTEPLDPLSPEESDDWADFLETVQRFTDQGRNEVRAFLERHREVNA